MGAIISLAPWAEPQCATVSFTYASCVAYIVGALGN
jgi:hypothetical protein